MRIYKNLSVGSGVRAYQIGATWIQVVFVKNKLYQYSYEVAGSHHVEQLKALAIQGRGLNTYINRYVRNLYDKV